jgi:hypothetical protein
MRGLAILAAALFFPACAFAHPARIIIARHAEKSNNDYALCAMGTERAAALAAQYLGRGASKSVFSGGRAPAAMFAITMHTIDTVTPAAQSWHMPLTAYTVIPTKGAKKFAGEEENNRTRDAARDVMTNPRYAGKTVLMVWEHKRIASAALEKEFAARKVTLRQLLHLDRIAGVPKTWPDQTYDYFWIIDFAKDRSWPVAFRMMRQVFSTPYSDLPANHWGKPEPLHLRAGCHD